MMDPSRCTALAVALLVSALACNKSSEPSGESPAATPTGPAEPSPEGVKAPYPASQASQAGQAGQAGAARPQVVDASDVKALLDGWLAAQNQGDFAAYEALYASRFDGVRRSGPRVVRLDREGWIADRKRMFKRPMRVTISDAKIDVMGTTATAHFVQTWASGSYEDVGPKQLVVVREGDALRIAREEMLSSALIGPDARIGEGTGLADKRFAFVDTINGAVYVVLGELPAGVEAKNLTLGDSDGEAVTVTATIADVPADVAAWQRQKVRSGDCVGTIGAIIAVSHVVPHFSTSQMWDGTLEGEDGTPYTEAEIAQDAFHAESAVLAGKLIDVQPAGCTTGVFARHASLPPATTITAEPAGALRDAAIAAFRQTRQYQQIQKDYRSSPEGAAGGHWDEFSDADQPGRADPGVQVFRHGGTTLALVQASVGVGCGQYEASLSALFKVDESGKRATFVLLHETPSSYTVAAAIDLGAGPGAGPGAGSGAGSNLGVDSNAADASQIVLLVRDPRGLDRTLLALDGATLRSVHVPYFDCDC